MRFIQKLLDFFKKITKNSIRLQISGFPGDSIKIPELEKCEKMKSINHHCRGVTKTLTITKNSKLRNRLLDFRGISEFLILDFF